VKFSSAVMVPVAKKTFRKRGRGRKLMCPKTQPSTQEAAAAKPLGRGKKPLAQIFGHSVAEKASLAGIGNAGGKPKCALNLFSSDSSLSDDGTNPSQRPRKHAKDSSISKQIVKPALARGMFE
jgi:hypothetical protein